MIDADDGFRLLREETTQERPRPHRIAERRAPLEETENGPRERLALVATNLATEIRARPRLSLLVAIGVGFAVGGALSTRVGRAALAAAGRYVLKRIAAPHGF
jgi:hypothetical protein